MQSVLSHFRHKFNENPFTGLRGTVVVYTDQITVFDFPAELQKQLGFGICRYSQSQNKWITVCLNTDLKLIYFS